MNHSPKSEKRSLVASKLARMSGLAYRSDGEEVFRNPKVDAVAKVLKATKSSGMLLRAVLPDHDALIGSGTHSLVFADRDVVRKKEFTTAGLSEAALHDRNAHRREEYEAAVDRFGRLVHPTVFGIGELRLRPVGRYAVSEASQPMIRGGIDAMSPAGLSFLRQSSPDSTLRQDVMALVDGMSAWRREGRLLDIVGRSNVLITPGEDPGLAIIDADQLWAYPSDMSALKWGGRYMENVANLDEIAEGASAVSVR